MNSIIPTFVEFDIKLDTEMLVEDFADCAPRRIDFVCFCLSPLRPSPFQNQQEGTKYSSLKDEIDLKQAYLLLNTISFFYIYDFENSIFIHIASRPRNEFEAIRNKIYERPWRGLHTISYMCNDYIN